MRIEICGGIGSGKTTLAKLIAKEFKVFSLYENFKENPFWHDFYSNLGQFIFETEITFLLQHYHNILVNDVEYNLLVCDFSIIQDLAYSNIGLVGRRKVIFEEIFNEVMFEIGPPEMIIHLKCDPLIQLDRIILRGIDEEKLISQEFLIKLNLEIDNLLQTRFDESKILEFNSGSIDFANNKNHIDLVLNKIGDRLF